MQSKNVKRESRKRKKRLIALLVVFLLTAVGYFGFKKYVQSYLPVIDKDEIKLTQNDIELSFQNNELSPDEYVNALYELNFVGGDEYKSSTTSASVDFFALLDKYEKDLDDETINKVLGELFLCGAMINEDTKLASNDMSKVYADSDFSKEDIDITKLDKMKLSANGNFVFYYTTEGSNAIAEEKVNELAYTLETDSAAVSSLWGIPTNYNLYSHVGKKMNSPFDDCNKATKKWLKGMLEKYNLTAADIEHALPVYIMQTMDDSSGTLAYHCFNDSRLMDLIVKIAEVYPDYVQNYAFPYFVVQPKSTSNFNELRAILGHELGHHYYRVADYTSTDDGTVLDVEEGFCTYTSATILPDIDLTGVYTAFVDHADCALAECDEDFFHYHDRNKGTFCRDAYDYQHFIDAFCNVYSRETLKNLLATKGSENPLVDYIGEVESEIFMREYVYKLVSGNYSSNVLRDGLPRYKYSVNKMPSTTNVGTHSVVDCTALHIFHFSDISWQTEKVTAYFKADADAKLKYMLIDDFNDTIVAEGDFTELTYTINDYKESYLLAIYRGRDDDHNNAEGGYSYGWGPAEITSDVADEGNQIKSIFDDAITLEFYPTNITELFGDLLPILAGEDTVEEMEEIEHELADKLEKDGVKLGKVTVSYVSGYTYNFLKDNDTDGMDTCKKVFTMTEIKISGHKLETVYGFTEETTNSVIINIIDSYNGICTFYKITADVSYVK